MKSLRFLLPRCILTAILGGGLAATGYAQPIVVTKTDDDGAGSLRQAIIQANANADPDTIAFNIPGDGPHTIAPLTVLPAITGEVVIDGFSQPDASANTLVNGIDAKLRIVLDGSNLTGTENGLVVEASNCTIKGLAIHSFPNTCVVIGISDPFHSDFFLLEGNKLEGNFIGTDVTGTTDPGETGLYGVLTHAKECLIGGATPAARNLISGNTYGGVYLLSSFNLVQGNFIGTDVTGRNALPNGSSGVYILSHSHNQIGGAGDGEGNVISGNSGHGIALAAAGLGRTAIKGNFIGTDITGKYPLGNDGTGVSVYDPSDVVIGDDGSNVIAYNAIGIAINRPTSAGIAILSNSIHSNKGLGIQLDFGREHLPDECDDDYGANDLQNYPELDSVVSNCEQTIINGTLKGAASASYRIEFFAGPKRDPQEFGESEGELFIGKKVFTLGGACSDVAFSHTYPLPLPHGWVVTATASTPADPPADPTALDAVDFPNTSQFSPPKEVQGKQSIWAKEVGVGPDWWWLEWLGYYNARYEPWIYHQDHGFLYRYLGDICSLFVFDDTMQAWWWTLENVYPYVYRFSDGAWLFYQLDSNNPRWFYNLKTGSWESW